MPVNPFSSPRAPFGRGLSGRAFTVASGASPKDLHELRAGLQRIGARACDSIRRANEGRNHTVHTDKQTPENRWLDSGRASSAVALK